MGIVPLSEVSELNVVGIGVPATVIVEPFLKLAPVTEIATAAEPVVAVVGVNPVMVGATLRTFTEKFAVPPPGVGFVTKPLSVPGAWRTPEVNKNVIVLPLTVPLIAPSFAVVAPMKPVPVTVIVADADPAFTEPGCTLVMTGAGFGAAVIRKTMA